MAEGVEFLLKRYPDYVAVDDLPLDTVQERVGFHCFANILMVLTLVISAQITTR